MKPKLVITLSDNHRRGIATTLHLLDQMLCEFEEYARGREVRSVFYQERNALTTGQKKGLLVEIKRMRDLMREVKESLSLDVEAENIAGRIWGKSSGFWEVLVETTSKYLRRYGDAPTELATYLDPRMEVLIDGLRHVTELTGGRLDGKS